MSDPASPPVPPRHRSPSCAATAPATSTAGTTSTAPAPAPATVVAPSTPARAALARIADAEAPSSAPDDPWGAVRGAVVDLVELTAATHVLAIHARLALATDLTGLPTSRARALRASSAVVLRHARVLRHADPTGGWAAAVAAVAESAATHGARDVERLPRAVAEELAAALRHHGRPLAPALPHLQRAAGHALALFVVAEGAARP